MVGVKTSPLPGDGKVPKLGRDLKGASSCSTIRQQIKKRSLWNKQKSIFNQIKSFCMYNEMISKEANMTK